MTISNADLLPSLLFKINHNLLALEAAIMELTLWVEQRGSGEIGGNVHNALATISKNDLANLLRRPVESTATSGRSEMAANDPKRA